MKHLTRESKYNRTSINDVYKSFIKSKQSYYKSKKNMIKQTHKIWIRSFNFAEFINSKFWVVDIWNFQFMENWNPKLAKRNCALSKLTTKQKLKINLKVKLNCRGKHTLSKIVSGQRYALQDYGKQHALSTKCENF